MEHDETKRYNRKGREIEDILRKGGVNPIVRSIFVELFERLKAVEQNAGLTYQVIEQLVQSQAVNAKHTSLLDNEVKKLTNPDKEIEQ